MRITRVVIENFRNLVDIDVPMPDSALIVGENRAGKTNFLHALRLVLDPSLSSPQRTLGLEDFSESLGPDPMAAGQTVRISVQFDEFESDPGLVATLSSAVIDGGPIEARLTYLFRPVDGLHTPEHPSYEWVIYGGDDPERLVGGRLRKYIHHVYMHALRDAESDLATYRRSPLRPLLDEVARNADPNELTAVATALEDAQAEVAGISGIQELTLAIEDATAELVGDLHKLEPTLDLAPNDPLRTVRALRLYLDGQAQRTMATASLGSLNILYLALMQLDLDRLLTKGEIEYALLSIEEPEAHLHPHLQRKMFSSLLDGDGPKRTTIVSTHSPHIVSSVDPQRLILLRSTPNGTSAFAAAQANLSEVEWDDLGRYLDATRAEMVFARRVLLVEGYAEHVLLPRLTNGSLDEHGISVCPIHGVHFGPYVRFLRAIGTPFAVVTDGDSGLKPSKTGAARLTRIAKQLGFDDSDPAAAGLFCGDDTFESDLFETSQANQDRMIDALLSLSMPGSRKAKIKEAYEGGGMTGEQFLGYIKPAKGRFAQRLAATSDQLDAPDYIADALNQLWS